MNDERFKGYIVDTITLVKELARKAKQDADNPKEGFEDYNKGSVMAYCSVFSLLKHQAMIFNIDEKELGLADIDTETDLFRLYTKIDIESDENGYK